MHQTVTNADRERAKKVIEAKWPRLYLAKYHHLTTKGEKLKFHNRHWAIPIYKDNSDKIVIRKSSQIGMTDWALCELFAQARNGRSVMYILPTDTMVYDFAPRRVDKTIGRVKLYRENYLTGRKDSDSKKQKTLFGVDCFIVGTNSEKNFFEKPVDVLIVDEVDLCDQDNLDFADDRIAASTDETGQAQEIIRKLGNPSVTGTGIDAEYSDSDKKIWMIPCGHCGEWQTIDWFENFVREENPGQYVLRDESLITSSNAGGGDIRAICHRCEKPIDRLAPGEWVAEYLDRSISGYHPSQLFADARRGSVMLTLWEKFQKALKNQEKLQKFYNQKLGLPFAGSGVKFTREILEACAKDYTMPMKATNTFAGVDVGSVLHVHIAKMRTKNIARTLFAGTVPDWYELESLCKRLGVQCGVVDHMPEKHQAEEWVESHPNWYVCDYNLADTSKVPIDVDDIQQAIRANRTSSLDESLEWVLDVKWEFPQDWETLDGGDFVKQMCASTRVAKVDANGNTKFIWTKAIDHHQHSHNYCRLAIEQGLFGGEIAWL